MTDIPLKRNLNLTLILHRIELLKDLSKTPPDYIWKVELEMNNHEQACDFRFKTHQLNTPVKHTVCLNRMSDGSSTAPGTQLTTPQTITINGLLKKSMQIQ